MTKAAGIAYGSDESLRHIVADETSVEVPDRQRGVIQGCQEILAHIADTGGVAFQTFHYKADVLAVQLQELALYDLCGLVIPGDTDGAPGCADRIDHELQYFCENIPVMRKVLQENLIRDVLRNEFSVLLSLTRIASFRFPDVTLSERSEGKRIRITLFNIIILSIIRS